MIQAQRRTNSGPVRSDDGIRGLLDLFGRNPTPARVTTHVEQLLAGWREALDPDACAEQLDVLRESLLDGIAQTEESAAGIDPASKAEARQAAAMVAAMRTAYQATEAAELMPA